MPHVFRKTRLYSLLTAFLFGIALRTARAQVAVNSSEDPYKEQNTDATGMNCGSHTPITFTVAAIGDGLDRYANLFVERGQWQLRNINWAAPSGSDAYSLMLAGRKFRIAHGLDLGILAGPWYEYSNHAFDEAVVDTNIQFQGENIRFTAINEWGIPLKATGYFFDSHTQAIGGFPGLPSWIGARAQEEYERGGFDTVGVGPMFTKRKGNISIGAAPYWDFMRKTADLRLTISYSVRLR